METPGLACGKLLGDCDVSTPSWECDRASSLCCGGTPGLEDSGISCFTMPALGWDGVLGFRSGTCVLAVMGNRVPGFWCDGTLGFRSNRAPEFEGQR